MKPKPLSRQRLWQIAQKAQGRCERCGKMRDGYSKRVCNECLDKERERNSRPPLAERPFGRILDPHESARRRCLAAIERHRKWIERYKARLAKMEQTNGS